MEAVSSPQTSVPTFFSFPSDGRTSFPTTGIYIPFYMASYSRR